jgi:hypothetical protein
MLTESSYRTVCLCALLCFSTTAINAQDDKPAADAAKKAPPAADEEKQAPPKPVEAKPKLPELPKIADGPKTNDPAAFMPTPLAKAATVDFAD